MLTPPLVITIDAARIHDWASFHDVFAEALGFPAWYGRNMDAWNDCVGCIEDHPNEMTSVVVPSGGVLALLLENVDAFRKRCPEQYAALVECAAFVNWRRVTAGEPAVLALAFYLSVARLPRGRALAFPHDPSGSGSSRASTQATWSATGRAPPSVIGPLIFSDSCEHRPPRLHQPRWLLLRVHVPHQERLLSDN